MTDQAAHAPLATERRSHILGSLSRDGIVRVSQLADEFVGVTQATLRRDLARMEEEGLLERVRGGAVSIARSVSSGVATAVSITDPIAVLVPSLNYYWPGVVRGMEAEAGEHGVRLLLRGASYELQDERPVLERLRTEGVSGLIVAPNTESAHAEDVVRWITESGIPTVLVERDAVNSRTGEPAESVTTDHALGAVLAARHLAELGHERVGLVLSRHSPTSRKIAQGWQRACEDLGLSSDGNMERVLPDRGSPDFSTVVGDALDLAVKAGVTGVFVHSDPEAMAIVDLALARGISVPHDLSVIAYDDEIAELHSPALTAISPPRASVGRAAIDLLVRRIQNPDRPAHRAILSPRLVIRESTAAPRS